jgi:hypothetical protein
MKVITCSFNHFVFELNIELSVEEFNQAEVVIKEKTLNYATEILNTFGQPKKLVFSKYMLFDEDMTILCVFLVEDM